MLRGPAAITQPQTFGAKLRNLATNAKTSNPLLLPSYVVPAAWAPTTAYILGDAVINGGKWYICAGTGTSAGSVGPTTTNGDAQLDGSAYWTYYGSPVTTSDSSVSPTVTSSTSNPIATYPNRYDPATDTQYFRAYGGVGTTFRSTMWSVQTFNAAAATPVCRGASISFMTDALEFAFLIPANAGAHRLIIDGQYYALTPFNFGGSDTWVTVNFSTIGGRRLRKIEVEGNKAGTYLGTVLCKATDQVIAPPVLNDVRAIFISDSIMAGSSYGPWVAGGSVPRRVGKLLGWSDPWSFTTGATGYLADGGGTAYTYGQRIPEALTRTPDIWVFMGSTNDIGQTSNAITAAALACFQAIRAGGSTAPIIVLGVWPINNASVPTVETAVQSAVTQFADPLGKTYFIPIYGDYLPWVTGAWNNTAHTGSVNSTLMIAGDNVHPADISTAYLSERIAAAIQNNVLPNLV